METIFKKEIEELREKLEVLRSAAGLTQDELASWVGISRQTYISIIRGQSKMPWRTYLSFIFYFDANKKTHLFLHYLNLYPEKYIDQINKKEE